MLSTAQERYWGGSHFPWLQLKSLVSVAVDVEGVWIFAWCQGEKGDLHRGLHKGRLVLGRVYAVDLWRLDHVGTRETKLWVARSKFNRAIRAANKIFMSTLVAIVWSLLRFTCSPKAMLDYLDSVNGSWSQVAALTDALKALLRWMQLYHQEMKSEDFQATNKIENLETTSPTTGCDWTFTWLAHLTWQPRNQSLKVFPSPMARSSQGSIRQVAERFLSCFGRTRWCPSSIAKLVYNSKNYGLWLIYL